MWRSSCGSHKKLDSRADWVNHRASLIPQGETMAAFFSNLRNTVIAGIVLLLIVLAIHF